ncbi:MAG TPA: ATP-binding protein [bacterium]
MGLVFVNSAILAHGGKVWLESEQGKGTTFFLELAAAT